MVSSLGCSSFIATQILDALSPLPPSSSFGVVTPAFLGGVALTLAGTMLRMTCFHTLGRLFTFLHTTRAHHKLVTTGPYAHARHPGYAGVVLVKVGAGLCALGRGAWLRECGVWHAHASVRWMVGVYIVWSTVEVAALLVRAPREDRSLRQKFGAEWEAYAKRVPWMFIPHVI